MRKEPIVSAIAVRCEMSWFGHYPVIAAAAAAQMPVSARNVVDPIDAPREAPARPTHMRLVPVVREVPVREAPRRVDITEARETCAWDEDPERWDGMA